MKTQEIKKLEKKLEEVEVALSQCTPEFYEYNMLLAERYSILCKLEG